MNNNESYIKVTSNWENSEVIGVDVYIAWCSSIAKRVRIFLKKQYDNGKGEYPEWYVRGKLNYACEGLPRGWFVESGLPFTI